MFSLAGIELRFVVSRAHFVVTVLTVSEPTISTGSSSFNFQTETREFPSRFGLHCLEASGLVVTGSR